MHYEHSSEPLRILHLEDDQRDADLLYERLVHDGIPLISDTVHTEEAFQSALEHGSHDLILAEIELAQFDGLSALKLAKDLRPELPFIFVTRVPEEKKEIEALTNGATDYLLKNRLNRLSFTIRRAVAEAREPSLRTLGHDMEGLVELVESFESAHDAVVLQDLEDRILFWNTGAERLYGWQRSEVLGKRMPEIFQKNEGLYLSAKQEVMQRGEWKSELHQATKSGREIITDACWTLLRNKGGKPRSILAKNSDITDKRKMESRSLRNQRMEAIGILTGGIAHNLNNILAPVMLSASLLRSSDQGSTEFEDLLKTIEDNIQRGADLIKQLLAFCRGAEGKHSVIRLNHLIGKIGGLAQQTFPRNINIITEVPDDLWAIKGEATQIDQVLLNLCLNARDAMPEGGYLSIRAENIKLDPSNAELDADAKPGPYVHVVVTDTGCGIPKDIVDKIFEPFFTTKEPGKGTGLGLSTTLGIIRAHQGMLHVHSEEEKGSTFEIYFPGLPDAPNGREKETAGASPVGRGQTILLVDDEPGILNMAQKILRMSGYVTLTARDGSEAISLFVQSRGSIDLVISDIVMPSMDGVTLLGLIRKIDPGVRLIASSGFKEGVGADKLAQLDRLGVSCMLEKPYTLDRLLTTIVKALDEHQSLSGSVGKRDTSKIKT